MTPNSLATRIETIIDTAEMQLQRSLKKVERKMYNDIVLVLKNLETTSDGYIKNNSVNRKLLMKANATFDMSIKSSGYKQYLVDYTMSLSELSDINAAYFSTLSNTFSANTNFIKSLQRQAVQQVETMALNEGLIANVKTPLVSILNKSINIGGSFAGFLEEVKNYIVGIDGGGKLTRYAKTWTADVLFTFSRAYQQSVTSDLKLQYYYYAGGAVKDTRDFCNDRLDDYHHHNDIEKWADLEWAGKNPNTTKSSIFIYLGGYNCRHSLIPVHDSLVKQNKKEK